MRINNHKLGEIVYHDQFFEYFNQLRGALNIQPDDNAILRGLQLSQSGTNVNVSAGWATAKPVFISFIKNNLGDTIRPCEEAVATGIPLPNPFNGFVYLQFVMSSMVAGAAFYDVNTQLVIATAPTAAFPTGSIIGEVCLGSVSRIGALITISNVGRDFDAAPSGSPVLADSYDASTDSPPLSGMSTPSFYRVATAGTQVINGKSYDLEVGDLVFRDASGYSVVRNDDNEGIKSYDSLKPFNATDTLRDPATGDIYKCISAAPVGTPLSNTTNFQKITQGNQAYNASTNSPAVASIPNGTELFVETAGTQTIGGVVYDLNKGDLIKKSNAGTYSVIRGQISVMHIEKNTNYSLTVANIPEDTIIGLHNTHATNDIQFALPAGVTTDTLPDYVNTLGTIITVNAGSVVYVRSGVGNKVELLGSDITGSGSGIAKTQKTVGANTTLTSTEKFAKLTGANIATTLPLLSNVQAGDIFVIKNGNFFGNTIVPQGANTIDGVAGAELLMPYEMMQLRASVGLTEWEKI